MDISQLQVLRTDVSGMPLEWLCYQDAAKLYHLGMVAYSCGTPLYTLRGGINAKSGRLSRIEVNSIIATTHHHRKGRGGDVHYVPPLSNTALFRRDDHLCLYCGFQFRHTELSRDHVKPLSQSGVMSSPPASDVTTTRPAEPPNRRACSCLPFPLRPPMPNTCICRAGAFSVIRWNFSSLTFRARAHCIGDKAKRLTTKQPVTSAIRSFVVARQRLK